MTRCHAALINYTTPDVASRDVILAPWNYSKLRNAFKRRHLLGSRPWLRSFSSHSTGACPRACLRCTRLQNAGACIAQCIEAT